MRWFQRQRRQREFTEEIAHYLAQETEDNLARGLPPEEARAAAQRKFGNATLRQEDLYLMNTPVFLDRLWQDLKYGLRQLRRQPGFTLAAVLSLGLGIGANTAIFTLVDQIVLRLLPVEKPAELVQLRLEGDRVGGQAGDGVHTFPYSTYLALRDRNTVFAGLTGQVVQPMSLMAGDRGEMISGGLVAGNFFQVFGVRAAHGRLLTPDDDRHVNGHPVAVLQYDFWRTRFNADPGIVGKTIRVAGTPLTVIGVAAPGFAGTDPGFSNQLWAPISMEPALTASAGRLDNVRLSWFYPFARLKPGITLERAQAEMRVLFRQRQHEELATHEIFAKFPQLRERFLKQVFSLEPAAGGASSLRSRFEQPLALLQWLVAAVLLIATSNVAGLLLARGAARQRELAIRGAIGAGRDRIAGQLFTESLLLACAGGALGVGIGYALTRSLLALLPYDASNLTLSATPDLRVLAFAALASASAAVLFGLLPAWQSSRVPPASTLREEAVSTTGNLASLRWRKLFVGVQVALSTLLLLTAGLFIRTLGNLRQVDLGVEIENVVLFGVAPATPYDAARKAQVYRELPIALARVPGVKAAGLAVRRIFAGGAIDGGVTLAGFSEKQEPQSHFNWVTPGYFEALGIPVKLGRDFTWDDWNAGRKLSLVNEKFVNEHLPGRPPVGERFGPGPRTPLDTEIIGVVGDSLYRDVRGAAPATAFMNLGSRLATVGGLNVYVRTTGDPFERMAAIRAEVARVDRELIIVSSLQTLGQQVNSRVVNERLLSYLSTAFAVLATTLALVGLHGVLAFTVTRRTREIGIRLALGANTSSVVGLIAGEMLAVIGFALAAGLAAGFAGGRYVESMLFGIKPADPAVFGFTALVLALAALGATLWPALRAAKIDPLRALRWE